MDGRQRRLRSIPRPFKRLLTAARAAGLRAAGAVERRLWRRELPPLHLRWEYYGSASPERFQQAVDGATTELLLRGLQPHHRVLDVGCGIGNLALGLRPFLTGVYVGFDIRREAIEWCRQHITSDRASFRFVLADLTNRAYNAAGTAEVAAYRFPLDDRSFDYIFLGSVFTHLLPDGIARYVSEISRLLDDGGQCIVSVYLLNDATRPAVAAGQSFMTFDVLHESGLCRFHDGERPEAAVAIEEQFLVERFAAQGLRVESVRRGQWWNGATHDQDVMTVVRQRS